MFHFYILQIIFVPHNFVWCQAQLNNESQSVNCVNKASENIEHNHSFEVCWCYVYFLKNLMNSVQK